MVLKSKLVASVVLSLFLSSPATAIQRRHPHQSRSYMQLSQQFIDEQEELAAQDKQSVNKVLDNLEATDRKFQSIYYKKPKPVEQPKPVALTIDKAAIEKADRVFKKQQAANKDTGIESDVIAFSQDQDDNSLMQTGFVEDQEELAAQDK